jgi:hypothetical protein
MRALLIMVAPPQGKAAANLSGLWMGSFAYPGGVGPTTAFLARIEDLDGRFSGTTIEPDNISGGRELEADIVGNRQGNAVDFTKSYRGDPDRFEPIDYVGKLSADGNSVTGVWSLQLMNGTFEMYREAVWEEEAEEEAGAVVPLDMEIVPVS